MAEDIFTNNRIQAKLDQAKQAASRDEKMLILRELFTLIRGNTESIVDQLAEGVTIDNFDEVQATLTNEFRKNTKKMVDAIKSLGLKTDEQNELLAMLEKDNRATISDEFQTIVIKKPKHMVTVSNLDEISLPTSVSVNNLEEVLGKLEELRQAFDIDLPAPQVNVQAPEVNIPETVLNVPEINLEEVTDAISDEGWKVEQDVSMEVIVDKIKDTFC